MVAQLPGKPLPRSVHVRGDAFPSLISSGGVDPLSADGATQDRVHVERPAGSFVAGHRTETLRPGPRLNDTHLTQPEASATLVARASRASPSTGGSCFFFFAHEVQCRHHGSISADLDQRGEPETPLTKQSPRGAPRAQNRSKFCKPGRGSLMGRFVALELTAERARFTRSAPRHCAERWARCTQRPSRAHPSEQRRAAHRLR